MAAENHCTIIKPMAVIIVNVVADAPEFDQGEMDDSPRPAPSAISTSVIDTDASAPEMIAAQLTADWDDSFVDDTPAAGSDRPVMAAALTVSARSEQE
jgi:hypothetical protein